MGSFGREAKCFLYFGLRSRVLNGLGHGPGNRYVPKHLRARYFVTCGPLGLESSTLQLHELNVQQLKAMWASGHPGEHLGGIGGVCAELPNLASNYSSFSAGDQCTIAKVHAGSFCASFPSISLFDCLGGAELLVD